MLGSTQQTKKKQLTVQHILKTIKLVVTENKRKTLQKGLEKNPTFTLE